MNESVPAPHDAETTGTSGLPGDYSAIFDLEIESWCYGLSRYAGELTAALVHRVVEELAPVFRAALDRNHVFDLLGTAKKIHAASNDVVNELEICLNVLGRLPSPYALDEERQFTYAQIIDQAEKKYGGILECFEQRWQQEREVK